MSVQDDRELRERLTALLEDITPSPAPVARAEARGKAIRLRRWVSAAVALAVIAAGAAVTPALLRAHPSSPPVSGHHAKPRYKITIQAGPFGSGIVAQGVTNGKPWTVLAPRSSRGTVKVTGPVGISYFSGPGPASGPASVILEGAGGIDGFTAIVATVGRNVASFTISLAGHGPIRLVPVLWQRNRWIGVVLANDEPITRIAAYATNGREVGYSVPFRGDGPGLWLKPGQAGPARVTRSIGSGVVDGKTWRITADFGPWGYCFTTPDGNVCESTARLEQPKPGQLMRPLECGAINGALTGPFAGITAVAPDVGTVELKFSDGSMASFRPVEVGGGRMLGYAIPSPQVRVVSTAFYSLSGRTLGATPGAPMVC